MHILVIDDDPAIRDFLQEVLEDEGYNVTSATHGAEGLRYLQHSARPPCAILLDLMMPMMDGVQFRSAQLNDPALAPTPVIVLSAAPDLHHQAARMQAVAFFPKPLPLEPLLTTMQRLCGQRDTP